MNVDVLHTLDHQQVPQRSEGTMHQVQALADLPELDIGELGKRRVVAGGVVVAPRGSPRNPVGGTVVGGVRRGEPPKWEKLIQRGLEVGRDALLGARALL